MPIVRVSLWMHFTPNTQGWKENQRRFCEIYWNTGKFSQQCKFKNSKLAVILKYIHSKGYIYRDIKASNIIVSKEGRVKLVDMGLAKKINEGR